MSCNKRPAFARPNLRTAFGQVLVNITANTVPSQAEITATLNEFAPLCGIADVQFIRTFDQLAAGECFAFKVKVIYEQCYFGRGYPPLLFVSTCGADEHTYNATVRDLCASSNGQVAYFRIGLSVAGTNDTCYPNCGTASLETGQVAFNIFAIQGNECK
jgi:hypothetical protein